MPKKKVNISFLAGVRFKKSFVFSDGYKIGKLM